MSKEANNQWMPSIQREELRKHTPVQIDFQIPYQSALENN